MANILNSSKTKVIGGYKRDQIPSPEGQDLKHAKYYWVCRVDGDQRPTNLRVLQWSPIQKGWLLPDDLGTGTPVISEMEGSVIIEEAINPIVPEKIY